MITNEAYIAELKKRAKRAAEKYDRETHLLDCGNSMAQMVNPRAARWAREFNLAMDALALVDSSCPSDRL